MADFITFGGVKLDKSQVKTTTTTTLKNEYGKSEKYFIVYFKNGQKVAYTESQDGSISASKDVAYNRTNIYGVMGLELIGSSKDMDLIDIRSSEIKYVDVSGDGGGDSVKVTNSTAKTTGPYGFVGNVFDSLGMHGEICTDKDDDTNIKHFKDEEYTKEGKMFINSAHGQIFGVHRFDTK